ncbi:MAG: hypothetical protein JST17_11905 [Bacteroidetes bacterium]|nr:hypothetical protein [Bacteroidota bacterium]
MDCFHFLQGGFWNFTPNWFDWFSLLVAILSIFGGYWIATRIYSKEKCDKENEEKELLASEVNLFKNSLTQLSISVKNQIQSLKEYTERKDFKLKFNQGVNADFLHFINVKYLYKDKGVENQKEIAQINKLLSSLFTLNDFRFSLRDELRTYIKKYNFHEDKFYSYRKLLYTKYFELCNLRGIDFKFENGIKKWKLRDDDLFMIRYTEKRLEAFQDNEVITENGLKDRAKLIEKFILPLIHISADYIPEDYNAIEINDIANEVNSAHSDMEYVTQTHFQAVNSYLDILEDINSKVSEYMQ